LSRRRKLTVAELTSITTPEPRAALLVGLGLGAVAVAVLALLAPIRRGAPATPPRPIDRGWAVAGDGASPSARGTASVAPERQATLLGPTGKVLLDGPARARWKGDRLALLGGSGRVTGRATVEGAGGCRVCVDGAADVAVEAEMLAVTILAGTVEVESGGTACRVIERHPPAPEGDTQVTSAEQGREPGDPVPGAGSVRPAPEEPSPSAGPATAFDEIGGESPEAGASELARQLQAYDAAMALRGVADARALAAWRRFARRWPSSPMLHEVLLNEVDALERLG